MDPKFCDESSFILESVRILSDSDIYVQWNESRRIDPLAFHAMRARVAPVGATRALQRPAANPDSWWAPQVGDARQLGYSTEPSWSRSDP